MSMINTQLSAAREFCFKQPLYASKQCSLFGEDGHACSKDKGHADGLCFCECGYEWSGLMIDNISNLSKTLDECASKCDLEDKQYFISNVTEGTACGTLSMDVIEKAEKEIIALGPLLVEIAAEKITMARLHQYFKQVYPPPPFPTMVSALTSICGVPLQEDNNVEHGFAELRFNDKSVERCKLW